MPASRGTTILLAACALALPACGGGDEAPKNGRAEFRREAGALCRELVGKLSALQPIRTPAAEQQAADVLESVVGRMWELDPPAQDAAGYNGLVRGYERYLRVVRQLRKARRQPLGPTATQTAVAEISSALRTVDAYADRLKLPGCT